jgi:hypothetical protein
MSGPEKEHPQKQDQPEEGQASSSPSEIPALPQRSGVLPNAVDITGRVPEDVRIDPNITEGHPGYEESGESEIIPMERLTQPGESS